MKPGSNIQNVLLFLILLHLRFLCWTYLYANVNYLCVYFPLGESYLETEIVLDFFTSVTFVTEAGCGDEEVFELEPLWSG